VNSSDSQVQMCSLYLNLNIMNNMSP